MLIRIPKLHQVLVLISILCAVNSCKEMAVSQTTIKLNDQQIQKLKNKTLIIILPASQYEYLDDYNEMIGTAWTLTPVKAIKFSEFANYSDIDKYAYLELYGQASTSSSYSNGRPTGHSYTNTHYYLALANREHFTKKKKEYVSSDILTEVVVYPDFTTTNTNPDNKKIRNAIYESSDIRNYSLPFMLSYLRYFQKNIQAKTTPSRFQDISDASLRKQLGKDTLFIPDNLVHSRNMFTGKEKLEDESVFKEYKGIYKIVSIPELINRLKTQNGKPLYLFEYVLSSTDKYIGVLEVSSGKIVYRKYKPIKYNLKSQDLKAIVY